MLATVFVSNGVKALKDPEALVPAAEPLAEFDRPRVVGPLPAPGIGAQHAERPGNYLAFFSSFDSTSDLATDAVPIRIGWPFPCRSATSSTTASNLAASVR